MPVTYFHLGPGLLFGLLLLRYVDFPTFVAANVVVDWRAALVFLGVWPGPRHGWMHTYLGALAFSVALIGCMVYVRPRIDGVLRDLEINQPVSTGRIVAGAVLGVVLTVTVDALHHPLMIPFMPLDIRPFYGLLSTFRVRFVTAFCLFLAVFMYLGSLLDVFPLPTATEN